MPSCRGLQIVGHDGVAVVIVGPLRGLLHQFFNFVVERVEKVSRDLVVAELFADLLTMRSVMQLLVQFLT